MTEDKSRIRAIEAFVNSIMNAVRGFNDQGNACYVVVLPTPQGTKYDGGILAPTVEHIVDDHEVYYEMTDINHEIEWIGRAIVDLTILRETLIEERDNEVNISAEPIDTQISVFIKGSE